MAYSIFTKALKQFHISTSILLNSLSSFFIAILLLLSLSSCSYEEVDVLDIREVTIENFSQEKIEISGSLRVINPNSYPVKVKSIKADLFINKSLAGKAILSSPIKIAPNSDAYIKAELITEIQGGSFSILPILMGAAISKKVDIRISGSMKAKTYFIGRKIDFDYSHEAKL